MCVCVYRCIYIYITHMRDGRQGGVGFQLLQQHARRAEEEACVARLFRVEAHGVTDHVACGLKLKQMSYAQMFLTKLNKMGRVDSKI